VGPGKQHAPKPEPVGINYAKEEARILLANYKVLAKQLHPDKGGSVDDMVILNNLKDRLSGQNWLTEE